MNRASWAPRFCIMQTHLILVPMLASFLPPILATYLIFWPALTLTPDRYDDRKWVHLLSLAVAPKPVSDVLEMQKRFLNHTTTECLFFFESSKYQSKHC